MSTFDYQIVYGNQLADDLHNLFPDLIYNPTVFTNVQDVLSYMQTRLRNRFDLFTLGRNMVTSTQTYTTIPSTEVRTPINTTNTSAAASVANPSTPQPRTIPVNPPIINSSRVYRHTASNINPMSLLSAFEVTTEENNDILSSALLTNLLTPFFRSSTNPIGGLEPVIVRATPSQIAAATEIFTNTVVNQDICCTICQDELLIGCQIRKIKSCSHQFHKNCIDQWFERNVRCPICRHDIRENITTN